MTTEIEVTRKKLDDIKTELKRLVRGRDQLIDAVILGLAANEHTLIIGKHGEAKTLLVRCLGKISTLKTFQTQVHQETIVKDIVGLLNPVKYKEGKLDILKTDFWDADLQFYDEFLRGRTEFLDFLLEVMIERQTSKTVLGVQKLPVLSVIATSNPLTEEYNCERMDLALKDRFYAILNLNHLIENEDMEAIKEILKADTGEDNGIRQKVELTGDELRAFKKHAIVSVKFDDEIIADIFMRAKESGFLFSTRTIKLFKRMLQVNAMLCGREEIEDEDYFYVANLMMSNRFDKLAADKIDGMIDESLVSTRYKPLVNRMTELHAIRNNDVFIEKAIEIIGETEESYPELPKRLKERIDEMRHELKEMIMSNLKSITPEVLARLDTEEFKTVIGNYLEEKTVGTKYLNDKQAKDFERLAKTYAKNCTVSRSEGGDGFKKFKIRPDITNTATFKEIENLRENMPKEFFSQV